MQRTAILTVAGLLALSGCGGGSSATNVLAAPAQRAASSFTLTPYQVPAVTSPEAQAAEQRAKAGMRRPETSIGGVPTITTTTLDAPAFGPGSEVDLAIVGVQALSSGGATAPMVTYASPVVVNFLNYQRTALTLGSTQIAAAVYSGVRLVIDPSRSYVVLNGVKYPAVFGSFDPVSHAFQASNASPATIDFALPFDMTTGDKTVLIDFNVLESVTIAGGVAQIGPKLGGTSNDRAAVISGTIVNAAGATVQNATVAALRGDGSVAMTTLTAADGTFQLHALDANTYSIVVYNNYVPASGDAVHTVGADPGSKVTGPTVSVPSGYQLTLGNIVD